MPRLSASQRTFLQQATSSYHHSLAGSPAAELLEARGLTDGTEPFRLGYVADPLPGHESYKGMLAIPYLRRSVTGWSVVSMRFRCLQEGCDHKRHTGGKYASLPGDEPRMFNTPVLLADHDFVAVCEGEIDAISASVSGVPTVGTPGTESWKPHWRLPFLGYETVFILADNDIPKFYDPCQLGCKKSCRGHNPGMEYAQRLAKELPNAVIRPSGPGQDVNSELVAFGREHIRRKVMSD